MSRVMDQWKTAIARNGAYPVSFDVYGKSLQIPLTTNFDVMTIAAFWFSQMRDFFDSAKLDFKVWTMVHRQKPWYYGDRRSSLDTWSKDDDFKDASMGGLVTPNINTASHALDVYLSLPGSNMLDSERTDPADRFATSTVTSVSQALALRTIVSKSPPDTGFLVTAYSQKETTADKIRGTYNKYVRNMVGHWDKLIAVVKKIDSYVVPRTGGIPGEKFGDITSAKQFWMLIASIEEYMASNQLILNSQLTWGVWATTAGEATRIAAEKIIVTGSQLAGDGAAWAADQAGRAYGNFWGSFLDNVGLWGIAFVALLLYTR